MNERCGEERQVFPSKGTLWLQNIIVLRDEVVTSREIIPWFWGCTVKPWSTLRALTATLGGKETSVQCSTEGDHSVPWPDKEAAATSSLQGCCKKGIGGGPIGKATPAGKIVMSWEPGQPDRQAKIQKTILSPSYGWEVTRILRDSILTKSKAGGCLRLPGQTD